MRTRVHLILLQPLTNELLVGIFDVCYLLKCFIQCAHGKVSDCYKLIIIPVSYPIFTSNDTDNLTFFRKLPQILAS